MRTSRCEFCEQIFNKKNRRYKYQPARICDRCWELENMTLPELDRMLGLNVLDLRQPGSIGLRAALRSITG